MPEAEDLGDTVALMLEGLELSEQSMRCVIIWAGEEYPVTGGPEFGGKRIDEGGYRMHATLKIKVRLAVFPDGVDRPQEKQTLLYRRSLTSVARRFRIEAITNYYDAFLELQCVDPNEGA